MNANGKIFLSVGTLLGSLWFFGATVFIIDGEILFLFNSKDAFFLLYPSSFSTVRSSPLRYHELALWHRSLELLTLE